MQQLHLRSRTIAILMLLASALLYGVDYLLFGRAGEIGFGIIGNLAFLPIYVLFVTLMIERVIRERERSALRQKMNMVIGVFFSEVGTALIRDCQRFVAEGGELAKRLKIRVQWKGSDFAAAVEYLTGHELQIDSRLGDLASLKGFLLARRGFMLGLLENPNLLEHDDFTELLWAVFHLCEELEARSILHGLPESDLDHLSGDIKRAYSQLLKAWVVYMQHLKQDYPYLFSLAVRTNPLDPEATPLVY